MIGLYWEQANEFFLFAGIMGIAAIIFTIMTLPYKYVETDDEKKSDTDDKKKPLPADDE